MGQIEVGSMERRMNMELSRVAGLAVYPRSKVDLNGVTYFLGRGAEGKRLGIRGDAAGFEGERRGEIFLCPLTAANAATLRDRLPWLRPQPLALQTSAGCGDRLGLATPGHLRAVRKVKGIAPILTQQSMRENTRTGRNPQEVMDDALWGLFQEGWREPWGADADHLKTSEDIDLCVAAGYTFFTIDPGDHVDNEAHAAPMEVLKNKIHTLPWSELQDSPEELHTRYLGCSFQVENHQIEFDQSSLARAAAKYGRAIAHTYRMYQHLKARAGSELTWEFEMSVDETETPTLVTEHFFIASELSRLGVQWVSLAPRYVGRFAKGVDYIGDSVEFEADLAVHAVIARVLGPYKLSIHSGSDKFSIYPLFAKHTRGLVHLKTAGTSYLEALRAVAQVQPVLYRDILAFAIQRYPQDRATYHVSAELSKVAAPEAIADHDLPASLDRFDTRQVLHVTFGSVLDRMGPQLKEVLAQHEEAHYAALEKHFGRHLMPFER
jgi:hypothetical protein